MTDTAATPPAVTPPPPPAVSDAGNRDMALVIYILYLVPIGISHIIGVILAYVSRPSAPDWLKTHFTFQIRTFWIGLLYFVVACCALVIIIGVLLIPAVFVWFVIRCVLGISTLTRNERYPAPDSWLI
jgi:uncharacterized membrane protein